MDNTKLKKEILKILKLEKHIDSWNGNMPYSDEKKADMIIELFKKPFGIPDNLRLVP